MKSCYKLPCREPHPCAATVNEPYTTVSTVAREVATQTDHRMLEDIRMYWSMYFANPQHKAINWSSGFMSDSDDSGVRSVEGSSDTDEARRLQM